MTFSHIHPLATDPSHFYRPWFLFKNARSAFKAFLKLLPIDDNACVLLPAYIGWSTKEGSGVFDPISELGLPFTFYRLDSKMRINLDDYYNCFRSGTVKLVVIIHYFGYVDDGYPDAVKIARDHGAYVLEDEAHALLTDLTGYASGRLGDVCIFSLHKILPMSSGGMLIVNPGNQWITDSLSGMEVKSFSPWDYDLQGIAKQRRANALYLSEHLQILAGRVDPLWAPPAPTEIPQTFPVLVRSIARDQLYFEMKKAGFGVVSLYHTLIPELRKEDYPISHQLAQMIFNLPVHQDINSSTLQLMIEQMDNCMRGLGG